MNTLFAVLAENLDSDHLPLMLKLGVALVCAIFLIILAVKKYESSETPDDTPPPIRKPPEVENPRASISYGIVIFNSTKDLLRYYLCDGKCGAFGSEDFDRFISPAEKVVYDMYFENAEVIICDVTGRKTYFQQKGFANKLPCCDKGFAIMISCDNSNKITAEVITTTHVPPRPEGGDMFG